jgi:ubiquinone/menaquinone biosynthesis C-methylase UbiE
VELTERRNGAPVPQRNIHSATVEGFGREWQAFDQSKLAKPEYDELFERYFSIFPFDSLPPGAEGFDLGCGSGRWAAGVAPRVGLLHCIDPSKQALAVAERGLSHLANVRFHLAAADEMPFPPASQDFGYSLGVLHHIPDTCAALTDCAAALKPGAPFLVYLYYALENRPLWFRSVWKLTNAVRSVVSRVPFSVRKLITTFIAAAIYWPLARLSKLIERRGVNVSGIPLNEYRHTSFYTMRTDSLDRFGTRLEQRFTRDQIERMMQTAGFENIRFRESFPYWVACGTRRTEVTS